MPKEQSKLDFPDIYDANGVLLYSTSSSGTVAGLALLVSMSPVFGKPISLRVSHCTTDVAAIQKKSTTEVIEKEEKVSKPICIEDKFHNQAPYDYVGITAGAQLYFAPGPIKKKSISKIDKSILGEDCLLGLLQTWMSVDFNLYINCKQHNRLVFNLEVKQPTIREINSLDFF